MYMYMFVLCDLQHCGSFDTPIIHVHVHVRAYTNNKYKQVLEISADTVVDIRKLMFSNLSTIVH